MWPDTGFDLPDTGFDLPDTGFDLPDTGCTGYPALFLFLVSGMWPDAGFDLPNTGRQFTKNKMLFIFISMYFIPVFYRKNKFLLENPAGYPVSGF
jgi:hypothetical protein